MSDTAPASRLTAVLRGDDERVTPLELFFDLVFVLAITQCTALMAHEQSWAGIAKGMLILGVLWWAWVGYAWLTSVVDPEEGTVRLVIFCATAALLVAALCVPTAFEESAGIFAGAYAIVRYAHIWLFVLASRDDPGLRHSVIGLAISTTIGCGLIGAAALANGWLQGALWALALLLDMGGPLLIDTEGWRLIPHHFAERHGLIVLIALGESVVAIGAGAGRGVDGGVVAAAVVGIVVVSALWWMYFDVVALVAARRLVNAAAGGEQTASRATPFPTCTCRWSRGSFWWRSGSRERSRTPARSCTTLPRSRCSAARRSTCSPTSPFAGATCTASAGSD